MISTYTYTYTTPTMAATSFRPTITPQLSLSSTRPLSRNLTLSFSSTRRRSLTISATHGEKPTVLVAEKLDEDPLNFLEEKTTVKYAYNLSPEELQTKISSCDALIVKSGTKVTREVFKSAKGRLKVVGRAGVGIGNVDLAAAREHGCLVVIARTDNTIAAAEHGIALLLAMARNVAPDDASVEAWEWLRGKCVGVSLDGKTLAVIGFGKVGSEVARRAKGLGMNVIAHDPYAPADRARAADVDLVKFDHALDVADFISLHVPLTPATNKMLNNATFAKMKKGVCIVNVARGEIIDEDALVRALDDGIVAQAALHVTATPHLGASTTEAQEREAKIAEAVVRALEGELSTSVSITVNVPMVSAEVLEELEPFNKLAEKLDRLAEQLVAGGNGVKTVKVTYESASDPDDLHTRVFRAMFTKDLIEPISSTVVNLVGADFTAYQKGPSITEERDTLDGSRPLQTIQVHIANVKSKFASAISETGEVIVAGRVKDGIPHLTKLGSFEFDVSLEGSIILCRQVDQPGMIGKVGGMIRKVGSVLAEENLNVNSMTVGRLASRGPAVMAIGVDEQPREEALKRIGDISAIEVFVFPEKV